MRCTKAFDGRKLSPKAKAELRLAAVKRVEAGESPEDVAAGMDINRRSIYKWLRAYHYGGEDALAAKPVGGRKAKLSSDQLRKLARTVHMKNPQQLQFEFALWTLDMIREWIRREFNVRLSQTSVSRLMKRLGFSPQRPMRRAWQQDPAAVEHWRHTEYPKIAARARKERAVVFFADESAIRSDFSAGTTWAAKGRTPVVETTGARFSINMISAVSAQGHFRFMTTSGRVTADVFESFLTRLIEGMDCKVFLIVDGHPVHKAKRVQRFVAAHSERIELFYLPPYAPETNPDEFAWAHIKTKVAKRTAKTRAELHAAVQRALRQLQKMPRVVAGFFQAPTCQYANL